jgi:photosystem II stability/assembly factor-like uncharacterized protein
VAVPLGAVSFDKSNRGWITVDNGFLVSEDGGESWKALAIGGRVFLHKLLMVKDSLWAFSPFRVLAQTGKGLEWKRLADPVPEGASRAAASPAEAPGTP